MGAAQSRPARDCGPCAAQAPLSTGTTNNALVLNPSGGNVGVGTTAPGATLDVNGNSRAQTFQTYNSGAGVQNAGLMGTIAFLDANGYTPTGATIQCYGSYTGAGANYGGHLLFNTYYIGAGTLERMRITNDGRVGIGTTTPAAALQVIGSVTSYTYTHLYYGGNETWSITNPLPKGTYLVSMSGSQTINYTGTFNYAPFAIGTTQIASLGGIGSIAFTAATLSVTFNAPSAQTVTINFLRLG